MKEKKRVPTDGRPVDWKSPFAGLKKLQPTSAAPADPIRAEAAVPPAPRSRGRVDIIRQTAHRSGKTVTVVTGFVGIAQEEKERLAKDMQKACGAGGTVKEGRIEIQGDQRKVVARILTHAGFRPVLAGG